MDLGFSFVVCGGVCLSRSSIEGREKSSTSLVGLYGKMLFVGCLILVKRL